ncbi:MAG: hypothetical protein A2Y10_01140 [Planctomycetes bacterium GWF2_41_51]|nr:MAG: hypothetical protein A2Y10_01140 [Planctomycetes bacterium GWF2_41_51]HBG26551.1 hypothetical protein [Phycisphaerales bacterium]
MKTHKQYAFLSIVLIFLASASCSADQYWDGGGSNDLYTNSANWDYDTLPAYEERILLQEPNGLILVQTGNNLTPRKILGPVYNDDVTTTMTFTGGSLTNTSYWIAAQSNGGKGVINVTGSTCDIYTRDLVLGQNGGSALLNISAGLVEVYGTGSGLGLIVPGDSSSKAVVKITGGELYANQLTMYDGGLINIMGTGVFTMPGDKRSLLNGYISGRKIIAECGGATVQVSYNGAETTLTSAGGITHNIAAHDDAYFYGWPANEGIWKWGNEIVVGFSRANYLYNPNGHSYTGDFITMQAYSSDGGANWTLQYPSQLNDLTILPKHSTALNLTYPDFAFKVRNYRYWYSYDKAATWNGPYEMPTWGWPARSRTDYIVNSSSSMKLFLVSEVGPDDDIIIDRPFCAETSDGCLNFSTLNWITPSPHTDWGVNNYYTMPSTVKIDSSTYISAIRKRDRNDVDGDGNIEPADGDFDKKYIDIYRTTNGGSTWSRIAQDVVVGQWNPPSMIKLADGRICLTYGYRGAPIGIRAKISSNNGVTWGTEKILRSDGDNWDIGYPRTVQRTDGKVVTVYYYSTLEIPEQHIAATIWTP